jgi:hypothetical protein
MIQPDNGFSKFGQAVYFGLCVALVAGGLTVLVWKNEWYGITAAVFGLAFALLGLAITRPFERIDFKVTRFVEFHGRMKDTVTGEVDPPEVEGAVPEELEAGEQRALEAGPNQPQQQIAPPTPPGDDPPP